VAENARELFNPLKFRRRKVRQLLLNFLHAHGGKAGRIPPTRKLTLPPPL
jgi:hypothetical protein